MNISVAGFTQDASGQNVTAVRKTDVLGDLCHSLPGNGFTGSKHLDQFCFFGTVSQGFAVTIQAQLLGRDRGMIQLLGAHMTLRACNFQFGDVKFVIEGDGLFNIHV